MPVPPFSKPRPAQTGSIRGGHGFDRKNSKEVLLWLKKNSARTLSIIPMRIAM